MTVELTALILSVFLTFALIMIPALLLIIANGGAIQAGSRDSVPEPSVFVRRATRLRDNMLENMVLFVPLVLTAHAAGISNGMTVLGALLFFYARILHAAIYLIGWPWVRPLIWFISVIGMAMIALQLF